MDYGIAARQRQIMADMDTNGPIFSLKKKETPVTQPVLGAVKQPGYMPGGGTVETAPEMQDVIPKGYGPTMPQIPAGTAPVMPVAGFDDGGKVNVGDKKEENKGLLDQAVDYAKNLYGQAKAYFTPYDSEKAALAEKKQQINQVAPQPVIPAPAQHPSGEIIDLNNRYGTRSGEKRPEQVLKPIAQQTIAPYQGKTFQTIPENQYQPIPYGLYDEGGEVDVDADGDGKKDHKKALLSDGERVLSPEEAAAYEKEHPEVKNDGREGAPVDYPGRVLPQTNPPTVPSEDGQQPVEPINMNPEPNMPQPQAGYGQVTPRPNETESATPQPGLSLASAPGAPQPPVPPSETAGGEAQPYGSVKQPSYQPGKEPVLKAPDMTSAIREELEKRKGEAALKGDLMGLGAAIIGQRALEPVLAGPETKTEPETTVVDTSAYPAEPQLTGNAAFKQKMDRYKQLYQQALDDFTPEGKARAANIKEAMLNYEKEHPYGAPESAMPGTGGKVLHALADIGNVAGAALAPSVEANIPQSMLGREKQLGEARQMAAEAPKERQETAGAAHQEAETNILKAGMPKLATTDNLYTDPSGKRWNKYEYPNGRTAWFPEGEQPLSLSELVSGKKASTVPNVQGGTPAQSAQGTPAVPPMAAGPAPQTPPPGGFYGEKPDAEHMPATPGEKQLLNGAIEAMPGLTPEQKASLGFPEGYNPTSKDVKDRVALLEKMRDAQRQQTQDEFNNGMRKLLADNQNLMSQMRLEDEELKHNKLYSDNETTADNLMVALYNQQHYNDTVHQWQKLSDADKVKDLAMMMTIVNQARDQGKNGVNLGGMSVPADTTIGAIIGGPVGAAVGGVTGVVTNLAGQLLNGPVDSLKTAFEKHLISDQGYQVMQAYFNSLPGRLVFETTIGGQKATAMRMREIMHMLLNTVPQPDTKTSAWDQAFNLYYKPMEAQIKRKIANLDTHKGYRPLSMEEAGIPQVTPQQQAPAEREKLPMPNGTAFISGPSKIDGKQYYLDANHKKLGPVYKETGPNTK